MTEQPEPNEVADLPTSDCSICRHPQAAAIDEALLGGTSLRAIAGTFGVARSSVQRHRANHLSVEAITDDTPSEAQPLRVVEVHGRLSALADRLEKVVEQAARTRKATAAVAATRELRQTLVAIAELQANPELKTAASKQAVDDWIGQQTGREIASMIDFVLQQFGLGTSWAPGMPAAGNRRDTIVAGLVHDCLCLISEDGSDARFGEVDTSKARAFVEEEALQRAERVEAEVQRRVEAELRRREAQRRPAIEAREVRAIEGGAVWTA